MRTNFKVRRSKSLGRLLLRPKVYHIYGTGMPKNLKIATAIDGACYQLLRLAIKAYKARLLHAGGGIP